MNEYAAEENNGSHLACFSLALSLPHPIMLSAFSFFYMFHLSASTLFHTKNPFATPTLFNHPGFFVSFCFFLYIFLLTSFVWLHFIIIYLFFPLANTTPLSNTHTSLIYTYTSTPPTYSLFQCILMVVLLRQTPVTKINPIYSVNLWILPFLPTIGNHLTMTRWLLIYR